jgi:hypothetical protein
MKVTSWLLSAILLAFAWPIQGWTQVPTHTVEPIDRGAYAAIRAEGLRNSQVMTFAGDLADGIGARLMWSPNMRKAYAWSQATLRGLGAADVHLEDIGHDGLSWRQTNAWMRLSSPDSMVFVAQAAPWSVSSHGAVTGDVVRADLESDADFARYHGKLEGKIVFLGRPRPVPIPFQPFASRLTDTQLASGEAVSDIKRYFATRKAHLDSLAAREAFKSRLGAFLRREHVLAVVLESRDGENGGGTGDLAVDTSAMPGETPWEPAHRPTYPILFTAAEDFGRVSRLIDKGVDVKVQFEVDVQAGTRPEHGYNVVAEIPGSDPRLTSEIVILGAHLDSWAAGTGATDDGAGVAIALEVVRILKAVNAKPRRSIRIVLYGGEEEGLYGSQSYIEHHFGNVPSAAGQDSIPIIGWREPSGPVRTLPEYSKLSAAYNLDDGGGRIRGVFTGGNAALASIYGQWIAPLKDLGVSTVVDAQDWPADASSYHHINLNGITFLQDPLDYDSRSHHTNMDVLERLSRDDLAQAAVVQTIFVLNTANRDRPLPKPDQVESGHPQQRL